jgi:hypothetical protein
MDCGREGRMGGSEIKERIQMTEIIYDKGEKAILECRRNEKIQITGITATIWIFGICYFGIS